MPMYLHLYPPFVVLPIDLFRAGVPMYFLGHVYLVTALALVADKKTIWQSINHSSNPKQTVRTDVSRAAWVLFGMSAYDKRQTAYRKSLPTLSLPP